MGLEFINWNNRENYDIQTISTCIKELDYFYPLVGKVSIVSASVIPTIFYNKKDYFDVVEFIKVVLVPIYADVYVDSLTTNSFNKQAIKLRTACIVIESINKTIEQNKCPYRVLEYLIKTNISKPVIKHIDLINVFERKTVNKADKSIRR